MMTPQSCTASLHDSSSTIMTLPDDYGECDVSLQAYKASVEDLSCSMAACRSKSTAMLVERLGQFGPSSGDRLCVSESSKCSFETTAGHAMNVSIRDDCKAIIISTVIHSTANHNRVLKAGQSRPQQGSYSLMTKMMKYNVILSRSSQEERGRVCAHDGKFVYFTSINISALQTYRLFSALENTMLQAVEMIQEFAQCEKDAQVRLQQLRRRRRVAGSYYNSRTGQ